ncbi:hypothetical protein R1sor_025424 [Riccia sorocarpa]|uniref:SAGA-associated factor 11 n=1 Tax=Riccia sorocarpa TaxID=122646 RepID=A0ABD3GC88_9MARC
MSSDTHESDESGEKRGDDEEIAEGSLELLEELRGEEVEADESNLLSDDDMQVFGNHPVTDILKLVRCNICQKPLIERQFPRHYERCASLNLDKSRSNTESRPERSKRRDRRDKKGTRALRTELSPGPERNDSKGDTEGDLCAPPINLSWNQLARRRRSIRPASKGSKQTPLRFGSDSVEQEAPRLEAGPTRLRECKPDESAVCSTARGILESQAPGKRGQDTTPSIYTDDGRFKFPVHLKAGRRPRLYGLDVDAKNRVDEVNSEKKSHPKKQSDTSYSIKQGVKLQIAGRAKRFRSIERHETGGRLKQDHDISEGSQDARAVGMNKTFLTSMRIIETSSRPSRGLKILGRRSMQHMLAPFAQLMT